MVHLNDFTEKCVFFTRNCSMKSVLLVKYVRILLLPNRAGNNKIITPQEVKILPLAAYSHAGKNSNFLWGDNLPIG